MNIGCKSKEVFRLFLSVLPINFLELYEKYPRQRYPTECWKPGDNFEDSLSHWT